MNFTLITSILYDFRENQSRESESFIITSCQSLGARNRYQTDISNPIKVEIKLDPGNLIEILVFVLEAILGQCICVFAQ